MRMTHYQWRVVSCVLYFACCISPIRAATGAGQASLPPTLARLSFWIPPARRVEFEAAYEARIAPILRRRGLAESSERGRATPDSNFNRLFELRTPSEVEEKQKALQGDPAWKALLQQFGAVFGEAPDSSLSYEFALYSTPAGPGRVVPAGPGKTVAIGPDTGHWRVYNVTDGLISANVWAVVQDDQGCLWFCTYGGVSRYDGHEFTSFTVREGLAHNNVFSACKDRQGRLWFGTESGGASRYTQTRTQTSEFRTQSASPRTPASEGPDGRWTTFTAADGLGANDVSSVFLGREGHLWFGTAGGGVSRYDGRTFQTMLQEDGIAGNMVYSVCQDREGRLWFGTNTGVTRYRPPAPLPPPVFVDAVVSDRRYEETTQLRVSSIVKLTVFEFHGLSLKTRPGGLVYRYRLKGYDVDWRTTRERRVEYQSLPVGEYIFEVMAVDRDLVYSERPATVTLRVHPPYTLIGLWATLGIAVGLAAWQTARVIRRDRRLREANAALSAANKELFSVNRQMEASNEDLKEARQQADRASQAKSVFLSPMSHEIRTPMTVILGYAQILRDDRMLSPRQRRAVEVQMRSGAHLLSLINDILDLSRIEAGHESLNPMDFDLRELTQELSAMFALRCEQKGLRWRAEVDTPRGPVRGDRNKLSQALINLLGNAVKFTEAGEVTLRVTAPTPTLPAGGEGVTMTTGEEVLPPSTGGQGSRPHGSDRWMGQRGGIPRYLFEVIDTGPGISPERQAAMFEPFEQGEAGVLKEGTGLGLTIARRHVALMGGELSLRSEPGRGSTFSFSLPLPPARAADRGGEDRWQADSRRPSLRVPGGTARGGI